MSTRTSMVALLLGVILALADGSVITTQFHAQDGAGGYSYGHSGGPSSKTETGHANGVVSGSYSYLDGHGIVQTATYTADPVHGFTVHASNLPTPPPAPAHVPAPVPVPVAVAASAYHHHWAVPVHRPLGVPVVDTPEVAAAKVTHLAAVEHQKHIIASHPYRRRRSAPWYPGHHILPAGFNYHTYTAHVPHVPYSHHAVPAAAYHHYPLASQEGAPVDVTDTPEVKHAKAYHHSLVEHQKALVTAH